MKLSKIISSKYVYIIVMSNLTIIRLQWNIEKMYTVQWDTSVCMWYDTLLLVYLQQRYVLYNFFVTSEYLIFTYTLVFIKVLMYIKWIEIYTYVHNHTLSCANYFFRNLIRFFCHIQKQQIFRANIIDYKNTCYKSISKVNLSPAKVCNFLLQYNNMYVKWYIFIVLVLNIQYRKLIFFKKFTNVRMCKVITMCGLNPTHHPGMHSHNVCYVCMCTVRTG